MRGRHHDLIAMVAEDLAQARGAARALLRAATGRATAAREQLAAVTAAGRQRVATHDETLRLELDTLAREDRAEVGRVAADLDALATTAAAGAAGAGWAGWRPTADRDTPPGLYRVGTLLDSGPPVDPPALLPLLDHAHVALRCDAARAQQIVATLLLRTLGTTPPGAVELTVYDPEHLGGQLAAFAALSGADLLRFVGPGGLTVMLDQLVEQIRRINETVLAGEYHSLRELAADTGRRPEPWRVAVLLGGDRELSEAQQAQLDRIVRTGVVCGVHLLGHGVSLGDHRTVVAVSAGTVPGAVRTGATGDFDVRLDPPPPAELVTRTCRAIADRVAAGPEPAVFTDLLPETLWAESSASGLTAPVGEGADGRLVTVSLGDAPPHALIGGPSGSGKTNFLYAWIGALAARYGPDDLELYLLDFKEGVSFARFARGRRDPSWLPQMRLAGVNVNEDREFGLALLRFLRGQLRRRAEAAKRYEATKLEELRGEDPDGRWPRIVAVIDEFQALLSGRDAVTAEAVTLLEDLARRGRSQGIHLVLASQDVSGIDALWGRSGLVAQFTLRVAMPKARRILAETNTAAESVPRYHAVINPDSGAAAANRIVRIPDASSKGTLEPLQERLWRMRPPHLAEPRLFDGDVVPELTAAPDFADLKPVAGRIPAVALLGQTIDVGGRSATLRMTRTPGRNLAVLGSRAAEACEILAAAARSLARQHEPGTAAFRLAWLDDDAAEAAEQVLQTLTDDGHDAAGCDIDGVTALLRDAAAQLADRRSADSPARAQPYYLLLYAVDAGSGTLAVKRPGGDSGHGHLRNLLAQGPELRVHVLGWWRSVPRLRDDLGGIGARFDSVGAWVALDVHGGELGPLSPQPGGPTWYPRPRRGLYFDRATHHRPELIIPYRTAPAEAP